MDRTETAQKLAEENVKLVESVQALAESQKHTRFQARRTD
jgi:hypothetical protein